MIDGLEEIQRELRQRGFDAAADHLAQLASAPKESPGATIPGGEVSPILPPLYGEYDYTRDPGGLQRMRDHLERTKDWHTMAPINCNSLARLLDTIERLRAKEAPTPNEGGEAEALFHVSRSSDGKDEWLSIRDASSGVTFRAPDQAHAHDLCLSLNRAVALHLRLTALAKPSDDGGNEALEQIARTKFGLQNIMDDHASDTNAYNYHAMIYYRGLAHNYEQIARAALSSHRKGSER